MSLRQQAKTQQNQRKYLHFASTLWLQNYGTDTIRSICCLENDKPIDHYDLYIQYRNESEQS